MDIKRPLMTDKEIDLLDKYISKSFQIVEFGSGSSTGHILSSDSPLQLTSFETDRKFVQMMINTGEIARNIVVGRLKLIFCNIGETGIYGHPIHTSFEAFNNYYMMVNANIPSNCDCCLIDGRFRVATALCMLLRFPTAIYLFHDFTFREYYKLLDKYIDVHERVDSLIVYNGKDKINYSDLFKDLSECIYDPR